MRAPSCRADRGLSKLSVAASVLALAGLVAAGTVGALRARDRVRDDDARGAVHALVTDIRDAAAPDGTLPTELVRQFGSDAPRSSGESALSRAAVLAGAAAIDLHPHPDRWGVAVRSETGRCFLARVDRSGVTTYATTSGTGCTGAIAAAVATGANFRALSVTDHALRISAISGLVGYWRFDELPGSPRIADWSGLDRTGRARAVEFGAPGIDGGGAGLDGDARLSIPPSTRHTPMGATGGITLAVTVDPQARAGGTAILAAAGAPPWRLVLTDDGTGVRLVAGEPGTEPLAASPILGIVPGEWNPIVVRVGDGRVELRSRAGEAVSGRWRASVPAVEGYLAVGWAPGTDARYDGGLDELAIWARALTGEEIAGVLDAS